MRVVLPLIGLALCALAASGHGMAVHRQPAAAGATTPLLRAAFSPQAARPGGSDIVRSRTLADREHGPVQCDAHEQCNGDFCAEVCVPGTVTIDQWSSYALRTQRKLQWDRPFSLKELPTSHNSAITRAYGFGVEEEGLHKVLMPYYGEEKSHVTIANQRYSVIDQLKMGFRHLEIDVYYRHGDFRICHWDHCPRDFLYMLNRAAKKSGRYPLNWDPERLGCDKDKPLLETVLKNDVAGFFDSESPRPWPDPEHPDKPGHDDDQDPDEGDDRPGEVAGRRPPGHRQAQQAALAAATAPGLRPARRPASAKGLGLDPTPPPTFPAEPDIVVLFMDLRSMRRRQLARRLVAMIESIFTRGAIYTPEDHLNFLRERVGGTVAALCFAEYDVARMADRLAVDTAGRAIITAGPAPGRPAMHPLTTEQRAFCSDLWPTSRQLAAMGKRLVLEAMPYLGITTTLSELMFIPPLWFGNQFTPRHFRPWPHCRLGWRDPTTSHSQTRALDGSIVLGPAFFWDSRQQYPPSLIREMAQCSVTRQALDQVHPRVTTEALVWSWDLNQPSDVHFNKTATAGGVRPGAGRRVPLCTAMNTAGRWTREPCDTPLRGACMRVDLIPDQPDFVIPVAHILGAGNTRLDAAVRGPSELRLRQQLHSLFGALAPELAIHSEEGGTIGRPKRHAAAARAGTAARRHHQPEEGEMHILPWPQDDLPSVDRVPGLRSGIIPAASPPGPVTSAHGSSDRPVWVLTSAEGDYESARLACPEGYSFWRPSVGWENASLADLAAGNQVWLNFDPLDESVPAPPPGPTIVQPPQHWKAGQAW
ncbi:hypothetical protein H696_00806 [Fonticula alba]|uniref:C-type lectin domain-containing protein n=1 Tax=Fonticula alba TaxID=691883 RepID=A0A058ZFX8_FONAL|nr:hypothetical protein H696_00806 [Fonticula alba]KCV73264.1 hypothetical protein H696_00806 [Fonticula alba]|eukprot:XP_009492965.1 hypothetical protein H696_00806 [Fonticula alba]